jgi:hypothetical protein
VARQLKNWIQSYLDYTAYSEAPKHMRFWVAVSTIAGALRRRVWLDMVYFKWFPNFYIIIVAPPGIVAKSTTSGVGMDLLRQVPDIRFGPDVVTWPALVQGFAGSAMTYEYQGEFHTMSAMTLESSEFGNLLNPKDVAMIDLFVSLWDCKTGTFKKTTKGSGEDEVINPWINMIACTTPAWIAGNFPEYMIGGGFTSRCIFVYSDKKANLVAYPGRITPKNIANLRQELIDDLTHIGTKLVGPYHLSDEAIAWGEQWYAKHYSSAHAHLDPDRFGGYLARKQTHIHKLAMVLAAAESDALIIEAEHLAIADQMVTDLEPDMKQVFAKIGRAEEAAVTDRLVNYVVAHKKVEWPDAYRQVHSQVPKLQDFQSLVEGLTKSEMLTIKVDGPKVYLTPGPAALRR